MALTSAPPSWWRPALEVVRLLDTVAGDVRGPVAVVASSPEWLVPALIRLPTAVSLTSRPWLIAALSQLAGAAAFCGITPAPLLLATAGPAVFQTVLWLDPHSPPSGLQLRLVGQRLAGEGTLAIAVAGVNPRAIVRLFGLRAALRRAGWWIEETDGFLGPRAFTWGLGARLATVANCAERHDHYQARMRAAYAERWPVALTCRLVLIRARRPPC
jgi:hypothetical protein